jgi:hypothetical protein
MKRETQEILTSIANRCKKDANAAHEALSKPNVSPEQKMMLTGKRAQAHQIYTFIRGKYPVLNLPPRLNLPKRKE